MEKDVKELFVAELKRAGYQTDYDHGVPCVLVGDVADLHPAAKKVDKIAQKMGYGASRGVMVRRGASVMDVSEDVGEAEEEPTEEEPAEVEPAKEESAGEPLRESLEESPEEPLREPLEESAEQEPVDEWGAIHDAFSIDEGGQITFF